MAQKTSEALRRKGNRNEDEDVIDIMRLLQALWHRAWAIFLAAVIFGGAAFGYAAYGITPTYEASVLLYVNNSSFTVGSTSFSISTSELSAAQGLVDTYVVILTSRTTLEEIIEDAGVDYTYGQMKGMVSAEAENDTEIFRVTVTSTDPSEAAVIANTIADVLPDRIAEIVDGSDVRVVDYAVTPTAKAAPSVTKYTAVGLLAGIVISCLIIIILELMDDVIHGEEYLLETYNAPLLASVPDLKMRGKSGSYGAYGGYGGSPQQNADGGRKSKKKSADQ